MDGVEIVHNLDMDLDILGQQPGLSNLYTQLCFCYSYTNDSDRSSLIDTLTNGLERVASNFPWIAGQVVLENSVNDERGIYKIKALDKLPRLVIKDLTQNPSVLTMEELRKRNFPMKMLDEGVVAPIKTIAVGSAEVAESSPVFAIQATFIVGGFILTFAGQHNVMDMTGQAQMTRLLSKACHNEPFTAEELRTGNLERRNLIPLLEEHYQPELELSMQIAKQASSDTTSTTAVVPNPPVCSWAYFTFSANSLASLKSLAAETIRSGYISTDDALSAYIWQSITRARLPRVGPAVKSVFGRAVDPRRYLGIPETYTGLVQNMVYHTYSVHELLAEPLGAVAAQFRVAVDPKTSRIGYNTRALTTHYHRALDRSTINVTANIDPSTGIMLSSWSKVDCNRLDFNLGLGVPECVRRPQFIPVESLLYLMPKGLDGEIAVAMCLREEDMQILRADDGFAQYATFVG